MPLSTDLTDALIALIPEDGSRISNGEIIAALEQEVGEPLSDTQVEEAKKPGDGDGCGREGARSRRWLEGPGYRAATTSGQPGALSPQRQRDLCPGAPGL
jgi:hypothetical protein